MESPPLYNGNVLGAGPEGLFPCLGASCVPASLCTWLLSGWQRTAAGAPTTHLYAFDSPWKVELDSRSTSVQSPKAPS